MGELELRQVSKQFGEVRAVDNFSLTVSAGEFVSLLGPSGCGKTTTLRLIAGFEQIDGGRIFLDGNDLTNQAAFRRNIGMVFQNYALFPHMTMRDNVAFGLRMRRLLKAEIKHRVNSALELVRLTGLEDRYPRELSGGQQQRVAVARALVIEPQLLLLDEPMSNLDAKLREEMRVELKLIQQQVGIATVFVTHDQEEALIMSDRVVVMNQGRIVQQGTPIEVYERPTHSFVASFIGQSNLLLGEVVGENNGFTRVRAEAGFNFLGLPDQPLSPGSRVLAVVKQSRVKILPASEEAGPCTVPAHLELVTYLGSSVQYLCRAGEARLVASVPNDAGSQNFRSGEAIKVSWKPEDCLLLKE